MDMKDYSHKKKISNDRHHINIIATIATPIVALPFLATLKPLDASVAAATGLSEDSKEEEDEDSFFGFSTGVGAGANGFGLGAKMPRGSSTLSTR